MILLNRQIALETHQSGRALGSNGDFRIFYLKCIWALFKIFHSTFQTTWVVFLNGQSKHCAQG
jgi:hypothetical protein